MTRREQDEAHTQKARLIVLLSDAKARLSTIEEALRVARIDRKLARGFVAPSNLYFQAAQKIRDLQSAVCPDQIRDEWPEDVHDLIDALVDASRKDTDALLTAARATIEAQARDIARLQSARTPVIHKEPSQLGRDILAEVWAERYEELDEFRRNRGVRWRLHVTEDQARRIADILGESL